MLCAKKYWNQFNIVKVIQERISDIFWYAAVYTHAIHSFTVPPRQPPSLVQNCTAYCAWQVHTLHTVTIQCNVVSAIFCWTCYETISALYLFAEDFHTHTVSIAKICFLAVQNANWQRHSKHINLKNTKTLILLHLCVRCGQVVLCT